MTPIAGNAAIAGNADPLLSRSQSRFESVMASAMALDAISATRHDAMDDPKEGVRMRRPKPSPIHPGEILQEEFLSTAHRGFLCNASCSS
jgi:hypothetical protein